MSVDSSKEGREWMVIGAKSINVRLDDDECYIRIPSADDYEFIGPMPVDLAVEIVALESAARDAEARIRELEAALRAQCHRCVAGVPFVAEGIHACDEPTRTGEPCAGHECWLTEDTRALLSSPSTGE